MRGLSLQAFMGHAIHKKIVRIFAASVLALSSLFGVAAYNIQQASAAPPPVAYDGNAQSHFLDINALQILALNVAGLEIQQTSASGDSTGAPRAEADARNLGGDVLGIDISSLLLESQSQAPPSSSDSDSLLSLPTNPLLNMDAINVETEANWESDAVCVDDTLSRSATSIAELSVADLGLISLIDADALTTESQTGLVSTGGPQDERAIQSVATTSLESLNIAGVEISVEGTPTLTATASGQPGGASVEYDAPAVTVGGEVLSLGASVTLDTTGLGLPGLTPQITVSMNNPTENEEADGSSASGSVSVLSVRVFQPVPLLPDVEILDLDLMPMSAEANMDGEVGGLQCEVPAELTANDDDFTIVEGGGVAGNVLDNDTVDGGPVDSADVTLTFDDADDSGITVDADGTVNVPTVLTPGEYTLTYEICETANPSSCSGATITVTVEEDTAATPAYVAANDDDLTIVEGMTNAGSVTENDTADGEPVNMDDFTATLIDDGGVDGATLDEDGNLILPADIPAGDYTFTYEICENAFPDNCETATISLTVLEEGAILLGINDTEFSIEEGGGVAGNVHHNDTINGEPLNHEHVTLTSDGHEVGVEIEEHGDVVVAGHVPVGAYSLSYEACHVDEPDNCGSATVALAVLAAADGGTDGSGDGSGAGAGAGVGDGTGAGDGAGGLASTGSNVLLLSVIASMLVLGGVALVVYRRKAAAL